MMNIHKQNLNLKEAILKHYSFFFNKVTKEINKLPDDNFFKIFLNEGDNLTSILIGSPEIIFEINKLFILTIDNKFGTNTYNTFISLSKENRKKCTHPVKPFFETIDSIFNYKVLGNDGEYTSYDLTENLNIRSCVYCNRNYTLTKRKSNKGRLMNPQLDHWFPQSKFPLLQVSFFNLIPSCEICNSRVKKDEILNLDDYFHPYSKVDIDEKLIFSYKLTSESGYKVFFTKDSTPKIKKTAEEMYIDQMYEAHQYELKDLILMKNSYSESYLKILNSAFPTTNLTIEDVYRLSFGTELIPENFLRRPMSKFKYDILKELGFI